MFSCCQYAVASSNVDLTLGAYVLPKIRGWKVGVWLQFREQKELSSHITATAVEFTEQQHEYVL